MNDIHDSIYDDFKFKKNIWSPWFIQKYFSALRVNDVMRHLVCVSVEDSCIDAPCVLIFTDSDD